MFYKSLNKLNDSGLKQIMFKQFKTSLKDFVKFIHRWDNLETLSLYWCQIYDKKPNHIKINPNSRLKLKYILIYGCIANFELNQLSQILKKNESLQQCHIEGLEEGNIVLKDIEM